MPPNLKKLIALYPRRYRTRERPDEEQTHWMKLGVAWQKADGTTDVVLYAMPPADHKGEIRLTLKEDDGYADRPRGQGNRPDVQYARDRGGNREPGGDGDDIPF